MKKINQTTLTISSSRFSYLSDLARAYSPNIGSRSALQWLKQQMTRVPGLMEALERKGFKNGQRRITPAQVEVFFEYLGLPIGDGDAC